MTPAELDKWLVDPGRVPLLMGVLNTTPDSFSDGGRFAEPAQAIEHARAMIAAGASLIDVGGESTRPGSEPVTSEEQIRRVVPVIQQIAGFGAVISIDTTQSAVAEAALDVGATVVNDISAGRDDPEMLRLVARRDAPIILMHMQGTPRTMQQQPVYHDVIADVVQFLRERIVAAQEAGVVLQRILIDPGIGFGKTVAHNLVLLRRQAELSALGRPVVIGTSRKAFIGKITNEPDPQRRLSGTAASVAWSVANGAGIVRVHDVEPMAKVVATIRAIVEST